ncbi:SpvB/TcaC N-terminal domain-containing protein [Dactylosporangium siamense]|uniref:Insecticide toxin TcdB middle/N-terminal domain-containing protein n=1 Tax=Dactylosporangium siamense TaxID=685454 RepID=A0A919PSQ8_9ACTN|nr:SpvB/TcaC N-terminal domain-containing protein [Dactylosporangium siamense]GIG49921.1 hypothetical protein Dsi01nite_079620 [Dactylosporangium siamense]
MVPVLANTLELDTGGEPPGGLDPRVVVDAFTGGAGLTVPLPTTPARGTELGLALTYRSRAGNGDYGIGFGVELPAVTRSTAGGVPAYDDTDAFVLAGVGPLVHVGTTGDGGERVDTFRPAADGLSCLVERRGAGAGQYWRAVAADGTTSVYGGSPASRTADPADPGRVAQWLVDEVVDRHGNRVRYTYKAEDSAGIAEAVYEQGRVRTARRYPERISYGNHAGGDAFEVVFDYGERDPDSADPYTPVRPWQERPDPFSTYTAGFEIRTYRRCRTVLMFHRIPGRPGEPPCLVRASTLGYDDDPHGSLLTTVTVTGHRRLPDGSRDTAAAAPLTLTWSRFEPPAAPRFAPLTVEGTAALPGPFGLFGPGALQPVDLDGLGLPGLLLDVPGAGLYFPPRGDGCYGAPQPLPALPANDGAALAGDLDGDGGLQLLVLAPQAAGYFSRTAGTWSAFRPLRSAPTTLTAARGELLDLDGDGRAELMFVDRTGLRVHDSLGTAGFGPARAVPRAPGFPAAAAASPVQAVRDAGVFGDGLSHRVQVADGAVLVWPNLGHGRFAPPVRLAGAPRIPAGVRVYLADVDGSGTADLVLAWPDRLEVHRNRSGNGFGPPVTVPLPATMGGTDQLTFVDVLGSGTTAIVLSRLAPQVTHQYTDLCAGRRPGLLVGAANGLGARCRVEYGSSTAFLLADARAGRPWRTRMPAPVTVATALTVTDETAGTGERTAYTYHDGWFDPALRRFAGFGHVTTSAIATGTAAGSEDRRTRMWFHTGDPRSPEPPGSAWWSGDPDHPDAPRTTVDGAAGAYRALAGRPLRTEVYDAAADPLTVAEHGYLVRTVAAAGAYLVEEDDRREYRYDGDAADPRLTQTVMLDDTLLAPGPSTDAVRRDVTLHYPRRRPDLPEQAAVRAVLSVGRTSRAPLIGPPVEDRGYELHGLTPPAGGCFTPDGLRPLVDAALAAQVPYGAPWSGNGPQTRVLSWRRTTYWDAAQRGPSPLGTVPPAALPHHVAEAAFDDGWRAGVYGDRVTDADLTAAGYAQDGGYWWRPGPVTGYAGADGFHLPVRQSRTVPFQLTEVGYDPANLVRVAATGYADPETPLAYHGVVDYQAARLCQVTDANGVVRQVLHDPLGAVAATSVHKGPVGDGDLAGYVVRPGATFDAVLADRAAYLQSAATFHFYDRTAVPPCTVSLVRTGYVSDGPATASAVEVEVAYADGLGRTVQHRRDTGTGWLVGAARHDAAGRPVARWLPFVADTPRATPPPDWPPPEVTIFDALGREVRVDTPKGFLRRTTYTPWEHRIADEDDTVLDSAFYARFMAGYPADPTPAQRAEKDALDQAASFAGTPEVIRLGPAGNPVRRVVDALGDIQPDTLRPVTATVTAAGPVSPAELRDELLRAGYLRDTGDGTHPTGLFQPYRRGFELRLGPRFAPLAAATTALLRRACLTTAAGYDAAGRTVRAADPRLHLDPAEHDSARYAYPMDSPEPALAATADGGTRLTLRDAAGRPARTWDPRGWRHEHTHDGLHRPLSTVAVDPAGAAATVEVRQYGEHRPDARAANLNGEVYLIRDGSGTLRTAEYTIAGQPVTSVRRYTKDYTTVPDWAHDVALQETEYPTSTAYDALGRPVRRTDPDGATLTLTYDAAGHLATLTGTDPADPAAAPVPYLTEVLYDAWGQRERAVLGNGAVRTAEHEATTGRTLRLRTTVPGKGDVQHVAYTYDPVGNVTAADDGTAGLVFTAPQPATAGGYTYDAAYRLSTATGLQHAGLAADTYATGFKQTLFARLDDPAAVLVPWTERYTHDDAGNLVTVEHRTDDGGYTRTDPVEALSNRLAGTAYDAAGNPLAMTVDGPVELTWDGAGRLARTSAAARPGGATEQTWYCYDTAGTRTRTVVQRRDAQGTVVVTDHRAPTGSWSQTVVNGVTAGGRMFFADGDGPLVEVAGGTVRYPVADRLGSVGVELGADAAVLSFEAYLPFGGSTVIAAAEPAAVEGKTRRFTAQPIGDSTGLVRFPARDLQTWLGRWLETDPSGPADGLNLYAYTGGNPLTFVDPTGRWGVDPDFLGLVFGVVGPHAIDQVRAQWWRVYVTAPQYVWESVAGTDERRAALREHRAELGLQAWRGAYLVERYAMGRSLLVPAPPGLLLGLAESRAVTWYVNRGFDRQLAVPAPQRLATDFISGLLGPPVVGAGLARLALNVSGVRPAARGVTAFAFWAGFLAADLIGRVADNARADAARERWLNTRSERSVYNPWRQVENAYYLARRLAYRTADYATGLRLLLQQGEGLNPTSFMMSAAGAIAGGLLMRYAVDRAYPPPQPIRMLAHYTPPQRSLTNYVASTVQRGIQRWRAPVPATLALFRPSAYLAGLTSYVTPLRGIVRYLAPNLALTAYIQPRLAMLAYTQPNLALAMLRQQTFAITTVPGTPPGTTASVLSTARNAARNAARSGITGLVLGIVGPPVLDQVHQAYQRSTKHP